MDDPVIAPTVGTGSRVDIRPLGATARNPAAPEAIDGLPGTGDGGCTDSRDGGAEVGRRSRFCWRGSIGRVSKEVTDRLRKCEGDAATPLGVPESRWCTPDFVRWCTKTPNSAQSHQVAGSGAPSPAHFDG
jgi:hypothetical protein